MWFAVIICIVLSSWEALGANWAQTSGFIHQTVTFPQIPSVEHPHWGGRWGMASVVYPAAGGLRDGGNNGTVFLLGGDTGDGVKRQREEGVMDGAWANGYKNDVWKMTGTEWLVGGNYGLRERLYGRKIPKVQSQMRWTLVTPGLYPLPGIPYDHWIICEPYFRGAKYESIRNAMGCDDAALGDKNSTSTTQWSPRRNHASVYMNGYLWVLGGRAREFTELPEARSIGGITHPRVKDVPFIVEFPHVLTKIRETVGVKSDVWRSRDGRYWELVTPGCHAPQLNLIAQGNSRDGKFGTYAKQCTSDLQCYGAERCNLQLLTCECLMWSPREQHAVVVYGNRMYLTGGYASALYNQRSNCGPYACGDTDASGTRYFLNDVWTSSDGNNWQLVTAAAAFSGRGGHAMIVTPFKSRYMLWIFGGRGGSNVGTKDVEYFNDIWVAPLDQGNPANWYDFETYMVSGGFGLNTSTPLPWAPRTGHTVTVLEGTPGNRFGRQIFIIGGYSTADSELDPPDEEVDGYPSGGPPPKIPALTDSGIIVPLGNGGDSSYSGLSKGGTSGRDGRFLEDVWSWRPDVDGDIWRKDFESEELFGSGTDGSFKLATGSPSVNYINADSPLQMMQRYWVPDRIKTSAGLPLERRDYITDLDIKQFNSVGLYTIRDLANADKYIILKLRGYDFPQIPQEDRLTMYDVCDKRALALAIVDKCSADPPADLFARQWQFPERVSPVFGGPPPSPLTPHAWYGNNWTEFIPPVTDDVVVVDEWDGCTYLPAFWVTGHLSPNVNGLGNVDQITKIRNPLPELQELTCKQVPGRRAWHNAVAFEERIYVFGGKNGDTSFKADTWYRDPVMPVTKMLDRPEPNTPGQWFRFASNKPGCVFEVRIWDGENYVEIRPWVAVAKRIMVGFLQWQLGGPGNGLYTLYVRAVDPAGNRDYLYIPGGNVYEWFYISPTPWPIIGACIGSLLGVALLGWLEYRRRVKKAAMERYAMKRMRRKFKAMQRELDGRGVDWRTLYNETKNAPNKAADKRQKKKNRDTKKEAREAEKKKRDKEKERIKKKLKASKESKDKVKGGTGGKVATAATEEDDEEETGAVTPKKGGKKGTGAHEKRVRGKGRAGGNVVLFEEDEDQAAAPDTKASTKGKKYKAEEIAAGAGGKKYKAEEVAGGIGGESEGGTKQRKTNKRLKDYEADAGVGGSEHKKDA